jgi:hypothetical protein
LAFGTFIDNIVIIQACIGDMLDGKKPGARRVEQVLPACYWKPENRWTSLLNLHVRGAQRPEDLIMPRKN